MNYRKSKIIFGMSCIFTLVILGVVVYEYIDMNKVGVSATNLENESVTERQSLESFNALAKTASNIKADSDKANSFFIKRDEVVNFLDQIGNLSAITGANVLVKAVNEKKTSINKPILSVSVHIDGSYSNVYYALRMLEEMPYQTEIQNVRLSSVAVSEDKTTKTSVSWSAEANLVGVMF